MVKLSRMKLTPAFPQVKKAALGKDSISFRRMNTTALRDLWLALFEACMLVDWYDSLGMAEELGGSSFQEAGWWCVSA